MAPEEQAAGSQDAADPYVSRSRSAHVVCASPYASEFTEAVMAFLKDLGLTIIRHNVNGSEELRALVSELTRQVSVAILPVESVRPASDGATSVGHTLSPLAIATIELSAAQLTAQRCIPISQVGDPVDGNGLTVDIFRLGNSRISRDGFKSKLSNAGCAISAEDLADDQVHHSFEFPRDWWSVDGDPQSSPEFMEFLVDAAFNRELTQTKLLEEAMGRIRTAKELDLKYHYVGWKMAENWNALTDDRIYGHAPHRLALSGQIGEMATVLPKDSAFRYVSLGPGDGKTDVAVLPALAKELTITSCFFVDVSIELLQVATNRVITDLIETGQFAPRHIRAVLGDFEDSLMKLAPVLSGFGDRSFFSLSGFTVGNSEEQELLNSLAGGMQPGDFLLLDARLHGLGEVQSITDEQKKTLLKPYDTYAMKKFAFGPVEDICDYTVRLEEADIEIKYVPQIAGTLERNVDNAINVYIDVSGLYPKPAFRKKVKLKNVLGKVNPREKNKSLRLVTLTFYDFDSLGRWIDRSGKFQVRWKRNLDQIGIFLLERRDERQ
jgi:hypothetical protein